MTLLKHFNVLAVVKGLFPSGREEKNGEDIHIKIQMSDRLFYGIAGLSERGQVRENNEDNFLVLRDTKGKKPFICAVADGMGGENYGEVASLVAVEALSEEYDRLTSCMPKDFNCGEWLKAAVVKANLAVVDKAGELKSSGKMGSTLVTALLDGSRAYVANVGDSRAYLNRENQLYQITKDHSLVAIMAEKGLIKQEEIYTHPRRGELLRFLGQNGEVEADLFEVGLEKGDILVLCSDGLWEMVRDKDIAGILQGSVTPDEACRSLIDDANRGGGVDNITAVVINAG